MKRKVIASLVMLLAMTLLSACQQKKAATTQSEAPSSSQSSSQSSSNSSTTSKSSSSSSSTVASSSETRQSSTPSDEELYASTLEKVAADTEPGYATIYTFYDIDGNGTDELLTGYRDNEGKPFLLAIYYLKNGVSTYLSRSYVAGSGGNREATSIHTDGKVYFVQWQAMPGWGTAYLYQLRPDNSGYDIVRQEEFGMSQGQQMHDFREGTSELDLTRLTWKDF